MHEKKILNVDWITCRNIEGKRIEKPSILPYNSLSVIVAKCETEKFLELFIL